MNIADPSKPCRHGFTLVETVIAIGVLAVLLSGFLIIFTPAAEGIRKSIGSQEVDALTNALSNELVTVRVTSEGSSGFEKAFNWVKDSTGTISSNLDGGNEANALLLFQYRGSANPSNVTNGAPTPIDNITGKKAGSDYVLVPMLRKRSAVTKAELDAAEGPVFLVKCVQMIATSSTTFATSTSTNRGKIIHPVAGGIPAGPFTTAAVYPEAILSFQAEFYMLPAKSYGYVTSSQTSAFLGFYDKSVKPSFVRTIAVRR
jgi:prepilin-type N-terminal cleavage/methylation domain-containing protein